MADDILIKIKEAEQEANLLISNSKDESNKIIEEAKKKADSEYKLLVEDAKKKAKDLIDKANDFAQKDKQPTIEAAEQSAVEIKNIDKSKFDNIIKKLTERIVEDGNS